MASRLDMTEFVLNCDAGEVEMQEVRERLTERLDETPVSVG